MNSNEFATKVRALEDEVCSAVFDKLHVMPSRSFKLREGLRVTSEVFPAHPWYVHNIFLTEVDGAVMLEVSNILGNEKHNIRLANEVSNIGNVGVKLLRQIENSENRKPSGFYRPKLAGTMKT